MTPKQSLGCIVLSLAAIFTVALTSMGFYESKLQKLQLKYNSEHVLMLSLAHKLKLSNEERNAFGYANLQLIKSCEPKKLDKAISATPLPPMEYRMQTRKALPSLKENQC